MLSTKDVSSESQGGMPKTIAPGNLKLKVNKKKTPLFINIIERKDLPDNYGELTDLS